MKNKLLILFLLLITITTAFAVQARYDSEYNDIDFDELGAHQILEVKWFEEEPIFYEFTQGNYTLFISNKGEDNITNIHLNVSPIKLDSADGCTIDESIASCDVNIGKFEGKYLFFTFNATEVIEDVNITTNITTTDTNNDAINSILKILVLNDNIIPQYDLISPQTQYAIIQNNTFYNFKINYTENGSGLSDVNMYFEYFSNLSSSSVNNLLNFQITNLFTGIVNSSRNLVIDKDGPTWLPFFKYRYNLTDKAGNTNTWIYNWIYLDNETPEITLNTPNSSVLIYKTVEEFNFTIDDNTFNNAEVAGNFNPTVTCELFIENTNYSKATFTTSGKQTLKANLTNFTDEQYKWYVICEDTAGWINQSTNETFILDTEGPVIQMTSHTNESYVKDNETITFNVTDFNNVSKVVLVNTTTYNNISVIYEINSLNLSVGDNNITINATDAVGNTNEVNFTLIKDNSTPTIENLIVDDVDGKEATISWDIDENTTNRIRFVGKSWTDVNFDDIVTTTLTGADYETSYNFEVESCDLANNCVNNTSSFTTEDAPAPTGGTGGGSPPTSWEYFNDDCEEDWLCSGWSECKDSKQIRVCRDQNECNTEKDKPETEQDCTMPVETFDPDGDVIVDVAKADDYEEVGIDNKLTGAVVGGSSAGWIWAGLFIVIVAGAALGLNIYNKRKF